MKSLLITPSTGTTAILLADSLSSSITSSSLGPAVRDPPPAPRKRITCKMCKGLNTRAIINRHARITVATFQPPPLFFRGAAARRGGGDGKGGGCGTADPLGWSIGGTLLSIAAQRYSTPPHS